jgi:germination protein M
MKKIISIALVVLLLVTGCSFIGQKNMSDSDPIIPDAVQTQSTQDVTANAQVGGQEAAASSSSTAAVSSPAASDSAASSSISSESVSNNSGTEISKETLIDNGTGKGFASDSSNKGNVLVTLYYKNKDGLLVPVTRSVLKQEGMARAAIGGLVDDAVNRERLDYYGLYPVLPKGTKVKGMTIKNGKAVIDFSKEFMDIQSSQDEQNAVSSVVYTLTGFKTISGVSIKVEGKNIDKLKNGTSLNDLQDRSNTFINAQKMQLGEGCLKCDLYYVSNGDNKFNYLIPVSVQLQNAGQAELPSLIFSELSKKTDNSKYFTSIPQKTKLISCDWKSKSIVLNFSSDISNYGGTEKEDKLINQIYYTINQLRGVSKIKILIDGKEAALPEGTEVAMEKNLPIAFNKVMDK